MKKFAILAALLFFGIISKAQSDLTFGTDTTFEVLTWNIEWFPKAGQTTINHVTQLIEMMEVDLLAIQEVDEVSAFNQMVDNLENYEGYLESDWFAGLAFIYNTNVIQINDIYEIFTSSPYWSAFPRSPMVMDMNVMGERIYVINNHFKCCGDGYLNLDDPDDEETRRYYASNYLKQYIDNNLNDEKVIVLGDLNDDIAEPNIHNVFQLILSNPDNYRFADMEIASGTQTHWSYPGWPSHLDHLLITNELFEYLEYPGSTVATLHPEDYLPGGWQQYDDDISDHRPVGLRLNLSPSLDVPETFDSDGFLAVYPNPFSTKTTISFNNPKQSHCDLAIFSLSGKQVYAKDNIQSKTIEITKNELPQGMYFIQITFGESIICRKLIVR